ncbi:PDZ and LIM domain protein Zasp isoform X6 [Ischnura elegans]|uniref:PDZ and LIM domain protein Zasp isoform X6 n=1 Tax=Ischnura elegans TaxID=197161 RepID=UPI001ED8B0E4|nr:PDZ and LIM domain protein Zasp isoform X6 [Ischnura elegans]
MSSSLVTVKLSRFDGSPWGFRLQGGKDFGAPLVIQKVAVGSLAEKAGLMAGDAVVRVNQTDLFNLRHKEAQDSIVRSGNNFELTVQRGGQTTWKPQVTPVGTMNKPNASVPLTNVQPVTKTSLAARKPEQAPIGSGHNVSAKPFATVPQVNGTEPIKAIVNKQYNTPVGIYSEETIAETLSAQAEVLAGGVLGVNFKKNERNYDAAKSEVLKMIHEIDKEPREPEPAKTAFLGRTTLRFPTKSMTPTRAYSPGMQQMQKTQHYEQSQQYQHYQEQSQQYQEYSEQRIEQSQTYESQTQKYTEQSQSSQEYTQKQQESQPEASQQLNRPATPSFRAVSPIPPYIPTPSEQGNAPSSEQAQGNEQESSSSMSAQNPGSEQPATQPEAQNNPSDTEGDHGMPAPGSYPSEAPPVEVKCSGCEASIVGVFVRIKDKNLHVECFKCATCGTSLKNVGYYNINNKLYCDIHAKLVARHHPPAPNLEPVTVPPGVKAPAGAISAALAHSMGSQSGPGTPTPLATQPMSPQPGTMAPLPFHPVSQSTELETSETDYPSNVTKHKEPNQSVGLMPTMEFRDTRSKSPENGIGINSRIEMVDQNIARTTSDTVMQNGHRRVNMPTHFANETNPSFLGTNNKDVVTDVIIPNEVQKLTLEDSSSSSHPAMIIHENNNNIAKETNSTIMTNGNGKEYKSPSASAPKPFSSVSAPAPPASVTRPTSGAALKGGSLAGTSAPRRGRGILNPQAGPGVRIPLCGMCGSQIRGPFITALGKTWCPDHFVCVQEGCRRPLQDIGFVEEQGRLYCEYCFEKFLAPTCNKCSNKIKGDCLNAIGQHFHPECFACAYCRKLFGNNPFFLEDGLPYCEADWNELFTTKCFACGFPIEAGDKWVEALNNNYHSQCFNCSMCKKNLEGQSFYAKSGRPFCKNHAR